MNGNEKYTFSTIKRSSTVERIVGNIIMLIKQQSLNVGDRLPPERQLCELIGVSRPILREALKALQIMNIIDIRQGSGTYIKRLEPEQVIEHLDIVFHLDSSLYVDLYEARRILESAIARMAVNNITDEQLAAIEENIRVSEQNLDDEKLFYEKDLELHEIILKAAGNRIIPIFMQSINKLSLLIREKSNAIPDIRRNTMVDHRKILKALRDRDKDAVAASMAEHIANVEHALLTTEGEKNE
ncbi:FadR/GntR family transcriptional regulator [Parasphaerochaeta coccoides]|uniref:GntR domain protein n=1 Tax=Parasphaerochaeta coccoides (strain ATCC BAA-1237 / DSM 17374 / SPN1) TaxID=760011 RepID=F4GJJ7_PARC1|nr:FadR/GntR family transcriptional regulator [Parasphaerochaeta coccoides]AEC02262.1 GntR domain protein [Parasphaerochaeta coccoides DSM 17374]